MAVGALSPALAQTSGRELQERLDHKRKEAGASLGAAERTAPLLRAHHWQELLSPCLSISRPSGAASSRRTMLQNPFLDTFRVRLEWALSSLAWWNVSLLLAGRLDQGDSKPRRSPILQHGEAAGVGMLLCQTWPQEGTTGRDTLSALQLIHAVMSKATSCCSIASQVWGQSISLRWLRT